jgi:hypothetical protein
MSDASLILGKIFEFSANQAVNLFRFPVDYTIAFISIGLLLLVEILEEHNRLYERIRVSAKPAKWAILVTLILAVFILGKWDSADFLYFQF